MNISIIYIDAEMEYIVDVIKDQYRYFLSIMRHIENNIYLSSIAQINNFNEYHMHMFNNYIIAHSNISINELESIKIDKKYDHELKMKDKDIALNGNCRT